MTAMKQRTSDALHTDFSSVIAPCFHDYVPWADVPLHVTSVSALETAAPADRARAPSATPFLVTIASERSDHAHAFWADVVDTDGPPRSPTSEMRSGAALPTWQRPRANEDRPSGEPFCSRLLRTMLLGPGPSVGPSGRHVVTASMLALLALTVAAVAMRHRGCRSPGRWTCRWRRSSSSRGPSSPPPGSPGTVVGDEHRRWIRQRGRRRTPGAGIAALITTATPRNHDERALFQLPP